MTSDGSWRDKLVSLNLARNALTAQSLGELAPAIRAAASDLQELDLSHNDIKLHTDDDLSHWEAFLAAFRRCRHMKKLNLSHNDFARPKAWESLARIHTLHFGDSRDLWNARLDDADVDGDFEREGEGLMESLTVQDEDVLPSKTSDELKPHIADASSPSRSSGLPAIQHILLDHTNMTDACCLFLTYVLEHHRFVSNEIERLLWTRAPSDCVDSAGISYTLEKASAVGLSVLRDAEAVPFHPFSIGLTADDFVSQSPLSTRKGSAVAAGTRRLSNASSAHDIESPLRTARSVPAGFVPYTAEASLDRGRKKLQRTTIEEYPRSEVELWASALRMLALVREYLVRSSLSSEARTEDWERERRSNSGTPPTEHSTPDRRSDKAEGIYKDQERRENDRHKTQESYSSKLVVDVRLANGEALSTVEAAPRPVSPQIFRRPGLRNTAISSPASSSVAASDSPSPGRGRLAGGVHRCKVPRPPEMVGKLPIGAWASTLRMLADPKGVLSERQIEAIVKYGRQKETLLAERELLGKTRGVQIWWVLESMGCLTYETAASAEI